jgi:putative transposase
MTIYCCSNQAVLRRPLEPEQYTSTEFAAKLASLNMRQSLGRTGCCYDNALAESFFAALKNERVHRTVYPTRNKAKQDIAHYIEFL